MNICDFERSYIRWRMDTQEKAAVTVSQKLPMTLNNVRIPVECRAQVTDVGTGETAEYVLGASCKGEQVWVKKDIWHQPNADMCVFASQDQLVICKQWDRCDKGVMLYPESLGAQPERQTVDPLEAFHTFSIDLKTRPGRELDSVAETVEALFSETPVVSRTEYAADSHRVVLEYPVKAVNFSEREKYWQVDTGPVLYADFSKGHNSPIEVFELAYVAHNCPDWAEFIVNVPTPVADGISVRHYSQSERVDAKNSMIAVLPS
ncbi:MAG: hypothetical protein QF541_05540 [Lentisphaeria bacterium]|jgi:hypothetical protein|nr:hypothetical protein [Lentisphaeria bacterium]